MSNIIGTQPATAFETVRKDRFTGLTTAYVTLTYDITSVDDVVCWVNFIKQDYTNLTLTGTKQLNLGGTLVAGDIVEVVYIGRTMQSVSPTAGSVNDTALATDSVSQAKIADEAIDEARMQISNAGTNGQFLSKQSGNTGGLTWANAGVSDGDVTMAKLSTSGTEADNVRKRVGKVWVQFNGTGTVAIQSDFNVSSITDYGTGQYGVNFSAALADDDFAAVSGGVHGSYGAGSRINDLSTTLCKIDNWSSSAYTDVTIITLVLMGNSA